jgi:hypothetical protein
MTSQILDHTVVDEEIQNLWIASSSRGAVTITAGQALFWRLKKQLQ